MAHDVVLAALLTGAAFGIRLVLGLIGPKVLIFAVCYPILLLATLIAGLRAGLLTLLFSVLAFWYAFVPEYYSFNLPTTVDAANVALYALAGLAIIWIGEEYRRTYAKLQVEKARTELLIREMQHRSKNGFAVVSSIVVQSLKHDPAMAKTITGRLAALQAGDDIMWSEHRTPVPMKELLARQLASHDPSRLTIEGPDATVSGELARTLCLVVNELATNAVKYGSLSNGSGRVTVSWGESYLRWSESGGPPASKPSKMGFGTFLIGRLLSQHQGALLTSYEPAGLVCTVTFEDAAA